MKKSQLQLRIMASAKNNSYYSLNTHFIDLSGYSERPFIDKKDFIYNLIT